MMTYQIDPRFVPLFTGDGIARLVRSCRLWGMHKDADAVEELAAVYGRDEVYEMFVNSGETVTEFCNKLRLELEQRDELVVDFRSQMASRNPYLYQFANQVKEHRYCPCGAELTFADREQGHEVCEECR